MCWIANPDNTGKYREEIPFPKLQTFMSTLNKVTFYNKTISLSEKELVDLKSGVYKNVFVSYVGKPTRRYPKGVVFKTDVTDIQSLISTAKPSKDGYYVAEYR